MGDPQEQTREAIQKMVVYIEGLQHFEGKQKLVFTLIDLEWSLRQPDEVKALEDLPEEFASGHESGWGG